jgi:uncharacterized protein (DUF1778 family)
MKANSGSDSSGHESKSGALQSKMADEMFTMERSQPIVAHIHRLDNLVTKWHPVGMEHVLEEPRKRITARVSDNVRVTLEQAAELLGATVNQFVVQTAYQEAQRVIERESVIRLSQKDARKVLCLLDNPPKPNKRLKDAVKVFKGTVLA